jgi:ribulose-phosphate 3-epimerase
MVPGVEEAGADGLHLDLMDGCFVPNLTFGPMVVEALRPHTKLTFDAHLMVRSAQDYFPLLAPHCSLVSVHPETDPHLHRTLSALRDRGLEAGVALNPSTPPSVLDYVLELVDSVLIMTVNPGFGGQKFLPAMLPKIREARRKLDATGRRVPIVVDGGIDVSTAPLCVEAGATVLVAGTSVFRHQGGIAAGIRTLREAAGSSVSGLEA